MIDPWLLMLAFKMATAAAVVVGCSILAERSGPMIAALIATLPISAGPVFVFLTLDHDAAFIAQGALGGMASNLANAGLCLTYVLLAQRFGTLICLLAALAAWAATLALLRGLEPSFATMLAATVVVYGGLHWLFRPYLAARPKSPPSRPWYLIPMRAAFVAILAGTVTTLSAHVGPGWSGSLAALPIVLSSMIAMLQPRIGGPATAAVLANGALALIGFGLALASIHLTAVPLGSAWSLTLALAIAMLWNLGLMRLSRRSR
ncbi:hypothetical protein IP69_02735 [Bosea sp. AAP35]|uniref:hypothetical protein n=1 Tax=Bosea sp. AAP35 TaxID=1523417 RepID=UPI0006B99AE4|nr:hypothetical protein [Bosea sp. AAP35]KPF72793.1 hypothetical protein IP69_02735 [Bosea sp. AAP35]